MSAVGIRAAVRDELIARDQSDDLAEEASPGSEDVEFGFRAMLRRIDRRHPQISRWLGGQLDVEVPAVLVSVGVHLAFLLLLGTAGYAVHHETQREFESRVVDHVKGSDLESKVDFQDLDMADKPLAEEPVGGTFSPVLSTMTSAGTTVNPTTPNKSAASVMQLTSLDVSQAARMAVPTASMLGQNVSIKGNGAEYADGVDGAVDRIAEEMLRHLEKGRTLVVWAFDASGSLVVERERLSKHIETVYDHIAQLDGRDLSQGGAC